MEITAGVNHFKLVNEDPNGDIRFYANNSIRLFITPSKVSVPAPLYIRGRPCRYITKRYEI